MSDDDKTKVKIRAKELASIVDDDRAQQMYSRKGGRWVAIIELRHSERHEKTDGDRRVDLIVDQLELVDDGILDGRAVDHVRDIMAALHRNRKLSEDGPQLDLGTDAEPTVQGVIDARGGVLEDGEDGPRIWDGTSMPEDEPDDEDDAGEPPTPDDEAYEPHTFIDTPDATCGYQGCGQPAGAAIHTTDREPATT